MTYLVDSNVFIANFDPNDAQHARSSSFVEKLLGGAADTIAPALILTEVAAGMYRRTKDAELARRIYQELRRHPKMRWLDISEQQAIDAAEFAITANIRGGADAIIAHTAKNWALTLVTTDDKLREQVEAQINVLAPEQVPITG